MPLIVFQCEECKFRMKHVMSTAVRGSYSTYCPACLKTANFKFLREGDPIKDWYTNLSKEEKLKRAKYLIKAQLGNPPDNVA